MSLLHSLHRNVKTIAMPMGMVVGALLCRPVTAAESMSNGMITPTLIFLMLFFTFCRVKPRQMRLKMLHVWLLAFQIVGSVAVYLSLVWFDPLLAQGAMICVLAPVAMAAVVIGGYVGGQRNHDGHVQSDLQYGHRFGGSDAAFVRRGRPCYVSGDSLPRGTGAGATVRLRPVVPKIPAGSGVLGIEAQPDFVLYVVGVAGCRHRPHDRFYHRPGERRTLDRNRTGTRCDGDLRGSVRSGTDAGTPLR